MIKSFYAQGYDDAMNFDNTFKIYSNDPSYIKGYSDGVKDRKK